LKPSERSMSSMLRAMALSSSIKSTRIRFTLLPGASG
jgi:hypothetical protein